MAEYGEVDFLVAPRKRWRGWKVVKFILVSAVIASFLGWVKFFTPGPKFEGSPPRQGPPRNTLDVAMKPPWYTVYGKGFRPSRLLSDGWRGWFKTMWSPALYAGPIVHHIAGWDVYAKDICDEGLVHDLHVWDDDGDIGFNLVPVDPLNEHGFARYGWRGGHPEDKYLYKRLLVEVDGGPGDIRGNFPVLVELRDGDLVRVCGRWVYDRAHDHN